MKNVLKMGKKKSPKKNNSSSVEDPVSVHEEINEEIDEQDDESGLNIDLTALDGYTLPEDEESDEADTTQAEPKKKKRKRSKKKSKSDILGVNYREQEERRLEELLFGNLLKRFENASEVPEAADQSDNDQDVSRHSENLLPKDTFGEVLKFSGESVGLKPAWIDEDDVEIKLKDVVSTYTRGKGNHGSKETSEANYREHLERTFVNVHGQKTPKWAELKSNVKVKKRKSSDDDEEEEEEEDDYENSILTRTAANLLHKRSTVLPKNHLKFKQVRHLNHHSRTEGGIIRSVEFHKRENVALVAGNAGVVTLFQVDGRNNAKIQSIRFTNFPLHQAQFSINGEEFLATSNSMGHVQVHNIVTGKTSIIPHNKAMESGVCKDFVLSPDGQMIAFCGRFGSIHLISARSKEWITTLKMNGHVNSMTFSPDSSRLYSHGEYGEVYVWDMQTRSCIHKFVDDGCVHGTAIAISPSQQYLACGSASGVVNIYDAHKLENTTTPKPEKVVLNLVTRTAGVKFHPSSEMMSLYSSNKENAIRLLHFPSMTVFQNFPTVKVHRSGSSNAPRPARIYSSDFSPNGGYLALGLNNCVATLYRLQHYGQY